MKRLLWIAGVLVVVVVAALAGRRLWHRFRGQPDRADLNTPEPERP